MDTSRSSNAGGSSNNTNYATLLSTVTELKTDLERAVSKIRYLETQNRTIDSNYLIVKEELIETRRKYNEVADSYMTTVAEKLEAERQSEAFMDHVKMQLSEKTKEFELLRDKFAPQDIDYIRIKVQEELEIPHRQKLKALELELEQQRDQCFSVQREFERSKTEYDVIISNLRRELNSAEEIHDSIANSLRDELISYQEKDYTPEKEELLRGYKLKEKELLHMVELLRDECKTLSKDRDDTIYELETCKSQREELCGHLRAKLLACETDKTGIEHRLTIISSDLERKDNQLRLLKLTADDLTSQLALATKQASDAEMKLASYEEIRSKEIDEMKRQSDSEIHELTHQVDQLSSRLYDREELVRRAQREAGEMQMRAESLETDMRRNHSIILQENNKRITNLELELVEERNARRKMEVDKIARTQHENAEIEVLRSEVARLKREKEIIHEKLRESDRIVEDEKREANTIKRDALTKVSLVEQSLQVTKTSMKELESKYASAQVEINQVMKEKDHNAALIEALQKESAARMSALERMFKDKVDEMNNKNSSLLAKERKRADAYKEKCLESHRKGKIMSDALMIANNRSDD